MYDTNQVQVGYVNLLFPIVNFLCT